MVSTRLTTTAALLALTLAFGASWASAQPAPPPPDVNDEFGDGDDAPPPPPPGTEWGDEGPGMGPFMGQRGRMGGQMGQGQGLEQYRDRIRQRMAQRQGMGGRPGGPMGQAMGQRQRPRAGRGGQEGPGAMGGERIKEALEDLKKEFPAEAAELEELAKTDPQFARQAGRRLAMECRRMGRLKSQDPGLAEQFKKRMALELKSHLLARKYRAATDAKDKTAIEKELRSVLEQAFPLRCLEMEKRIEMLGKELERMKGDLTQKKAKKNEVIERHLRELTGQNDSLAW
jgi:uncharacterized small protein (DUF1192 family)